MPLTLSLPMLPAENAGSVQPTVSPLCRCGTGHQSEASYAESLQVTHCSLQPAMLFNTIHPVNMVDVGCISDQ